MGGRSKGSPLLAIEVAREHRADLDSELNFIFVEEREDRAVHLQKELEALDLPPNFRCEVKPESFAEALKGALDYLDAEELVIAPTFAFVDPFGIKGLPFALIERLVSRKRCGVLITFMNVTIRRFVTKLPDQINSLIGIPEAANLIAEAEDRTVMARQLFAESLRKVAKFVRFFEMRDAAGTPIYDLFFASDHPLGHYKMKEAMWKVAQSGGYSFSDGVDPKQAILFSADPGESLAPPLWDFFRDRTVDAAEVLEYTRDQTAFLNQHARAALKLLEADGGVDGCRIEVAETKKDGKPRRKSTFPQGTIITFSNGS